MASEGENASAMDIARAKLKEASALQVNNLEAAVELYAEALKACVEACGELGAPCAEYYLRYGTALFQLAQNNTGVLGEKVQEKTDKVKQDSDPVVQHSDQGVKPIGVDDAEKEHSTAEVAGETDEAENEQGEDADEDEDEDADENEQADEGDIQVAWELLDTARVIYQKIGTPDVTSELAETYLTLGDVYSEKEDVSAAIQEYSNCIHTLELLSPPATRRLAEAHFKMSLCHTMTDSLPEALKHCNTAIELIASRQVELEAELAGKEALADGTPSDSGAAAVDSIKQELVTLQLVMKDLKAHADDTEQSIKERDDMKAAIVSALTYAARGDSSGSAAGGSEPSKAVPQVLGVVGRGKNRITLAPVPATANGKGPAVPNALSSSGGASKVAVGKRSLEDLMNGTAQLGPSKQPKSEE